MYRCSQCGNYLLWDDELQSYVCDLCFTTITKSEAEEICTDRVISQEIL